MSGDSLTPEKFVALLEDDKVTEALGKVLESVLKKALADCNDKICELKAELADEKQKHISQDIIITNLQKENEEMKSTLDEHEQYSRQNCVRLWTDTAESKDEDIDQIVLDHARVIGADIQKEDISRYHRVGRLRRNTKPRPIIIRFISYRKWREFYMKRKNSEDIFISEDLTQKGANLFFQARKLRREMKLSQCWSSDGRIMVRLPSEGSAPGQVKQIYSEKDLLSFA